MTTRLEYEDLQLLTELFNEYCLLLYNRTYPLTDKNLFNYFLDFQKYRFKNDTAIIEKYFTKPIALINDYDFEISGIYCIKYRKLWNKDDLKSVMRNFNKDLETQIKNVRMD